MLVIGFGCFVRKIQFLAWTIMFLVLVQMGLPHALTQELPAEKTPDTTISVSEANEKLFLKHLVQDQQDIWLSPLRAHPKDAQWLLPFAGITAGLIATDATTAHEMSRGDVNSWKKVSDIGLATYGGGMAAFYLIGRSSGSPRAREAGLLAAEAGLNSLALGKVMNFAFRRQGPAEGDGTGRFFQSGGRAFYSVHSSIAWSFASVVAHEYPGWLSKALAYGSASAISLARVGAEKHFPSDVLVGGVTGYLIGRHVYRKRHDPEIDSAFGTFISGEKEWTKGNAGSTYVPLDSWVYPALERLIAAGYIRSQFLGLRPWTRTAIADMLDEASYRMGGEYEINPHFQSALRQLKVEFGEELNLASSKNTAIRLESVYSRSMVVGGPPLNDSYHFGQTIINDYGRPYQRGFNQIVGFTARAEQGRFSYYVRGEYQHAPSAPAYPESVRLVMANADGNPVQPPMPFEEVNTFRLLEAYASATLLGHNISVGKSSMWWGSGAGGAMIMSNNAEPFYMLRINRVLPLRLPWVLKYFGPVRYDAFLGQLAEHQFPPRPFMHGEKFSFKPTENLEFGFSRTAVFAGEGISPLTFGVFWKSFTSTTSSTTPGSDPRVSPGARHSQFDFNYRIPGLRRWLTLYSDSIVHDDLSPISAPRRAAINPGIYLTHVPKIPKLDLRVEAVNTDPPVTPSNGGHFIYWEGVYRDLYLNRKNLMGNWIGREGKGIQAWSTYWLSPMSTLQTFYRQGKIAKDFIPEGETIHAFGFRAKVRIRPDLELTSFLQHERWKAPVLSPNPESNTTAQVQFTFWPKMLAAKRK